MSQSVKDRALALIYRELDSKHPDETWDSYNRKQIDALSAAGLLLDERAQACVEACKAYREGRTRPDGLPDICRVWDAGAAYDAPKRTREDVIADLLNAHTPHGWSTRVSALLDELAALQVQEGRKP